MRHIAFEHDARKSYSFIGMTALPGPYDFMRIASNILGVSTLLALTESPRVLYRGAKSTHSTPKPYEFIGFLIIVLKNHRFSYGF